MNRSDLTEDAGRGYYGGANQGLSSSPASYAWKLGVWFNATGRSTPKDVRMGRGYSIRANNMLFKIGAGDSFERVS